MSSGIEPVFALSYTRKVLQPDGRRTEEEVSDHALRRFRAQHGADAALPACFVTAQDLTPAEHVRMQAAVQQHVDSAISKTVNVPEDIGFEAFKDVYRDAYQSGCKGCATYRPNAVTGSVLAVTPPAPAPAPATAAAIGQDEPNALMVRADKLVGPPTSCAGRTASTPSTSRSTTSSWTASGARSRCSSTRSRWNITPGWWR